MILIFTFSFSTVGEKWFLNLPQETSAGMEDITITPVSLFLPVRIPTSLNSKAPIIRRKAFRKNEGVWFYSDKIRIEFSVTCPTPLRGRTRFTEFCLPTGDSLFLES